LNLAVTYLYLGQAARASKLLKEVHRLASNNLEFQALQALAVYEESGKGYWTIVQLQELAQKPEVPPSVVFNLARLLELRSRPAEARQYWNRLVHIADTLPNPIRNIVCQPQKNATRHCDRRTRRTLHQPPPWKWPISFGWQSEPAEAFKELNRWGKPLYKKWPDSGLEVQIYQHPNRHVEVLKVNDTVQMQVIRDDNLGTVSELSNYCDQPLRQRTLARGELKSCGDWAALAFEGKVREIWRILR
jgi:hypothetical protein